MRYLNNINYPDDLKKLTEEELLKLTDELRQEILTVVSTTGGHLSSNLGAVELTVALHYVFNTPEDKIVWDVSHQTYIHKILTGRKDRMNTIRQYGGLAGFTKINESEYDAYGTGHASTSISAALGMAAARDLAGKDNKVIAVIGDGALTGGLAFEGLNNAGHLKNDLIVILNDNTWSISKNVGALSKYLTNILTDEKFNKLRKEVWELTGRFKRRDKIRETISNLEDSIKGLLVPGMLFQKLGFKYFGPIDGHDLPLLIKTLEDMKNIKGPLLLHIGTVKGKGYEPAEKDAGAYHGVGQFDKVTGKMAPKSKGLPAYTKVFGDTMVELAAKDEKVVAITAAMAPGTGLVEFSEKFPDRFFDVGIAEAHAGCFACGLACGGYKPYMVIYSTFMQRAYDQIIHDIALQKLPVVICMDRAGLVGNDGPTHHGAFDLTFISTVPNFTVAVPKDGNEMRSMLHYTSDNKLEGPVAIRYPRATIPTEITKDVSTIEWGKWETEVNGDNIYILAVGTMVENAKKVAVSLRETGVNLTVVNARFVKPMDLEMLADIKNKAKTIITIEENSLRGGFGQAVSEYLMSNKFKGDFKAFGIPDRFITHGNPAKILEEIRLDAVSLTEDIGTFLNIQNDENKSFFNKLLFKKNGNSRKTVSASANDNLPIDEKKTG